MVGKQNFISKATNRPTKGQLISEWNFGVFKSPKKTNQILDRFLLYEARAEICQKFGWWDLKTPKFHSDFNWPLTMQLLQIKS